jgi:oxygen-independent coproporphyrinogen-3 oxidase
MLGIVSCFLVKYQSFFDQNTAYSLNIRPEMQRGLYHHYDYLQLLHPSCILSGMKPYSVYIHIPFCVHRCAYCDFNTYAGKNHLINEYVNALLLEIKNLRISAEELLKVHTIFFGGGTPSLLAVPFVASILTTLFECFSVAPDIEISFEANPGTLSLSYLKDLYSIGVNRLSIGMQSAHAQELSFLERQHNFDDVIESVLWARKAGFSNLSLDLIFGLPEQSIDGWEKSLNLALDLAPEHFSLYALSIEQGTPMAQWLERGLISTPDNDLAADMYELACGKLLAAGYLQYEISNWAFLESGLQYQNGLPESKLTNECHHNLQYWRNLPYLGFGAGAHGFAGGIRTVNINSPEAYIQSQKKPISLKKFPLTPATIEYFPIDQETEMLETMMMGLRLTREGISRSVFYDRFQQELDDVFGDKVEKLIEWDLLEWVCPDRDILRLTKRGRLLGNRVFAEFT